MKDHVLTPAPTCRTLGTPGPVREASHSRTMPWVRVDEDLGVRGTEAGSGRRGRAGEGLRLWGQSLGVGNDGGGGRTTA